MNNNALKCIPGLWPSMGRPLRDRPLARRYISQGSHG